MTEYNTYRFWNKVDKKNENECWEWKGAITQGRWSGYGRWEYNGKTLLTHRVSWMIHNGDIPEGMLVCHHCDNPRCVNPKHLFLGTHADNWYDMANKGKIPSQTKPNAKLTWDDVKEIRNRYSKGGITQTQLRKEYGITSAGSMSYIIQNKKWIDKNYIPPKSW